MTDTDPIVAAGRGLLEGAAAAAADPQRPAYHFRPPSRWMNDPNGTLFREGWHHLFYQCNPFGDRWDHMHWGHARSRDLVHWEHLPVALAPRTDAGEAHCFSGCATVTPAGEPLIFYTSVGGTDCPEGNTSRDAAKHFLARGSVDLVRWEQDVERDFIRESHHGDTKIWDWRDPFLFEHDGSPWIVTGGNLGNRTGGGGIVTLYRADDETLTSWSYRGILHRSPDFDVVQLECPNLVRFGERWLLIHSPWHGPTRWLTGTIDFGVPRFDTELAGFLDPGPCVYATNTSHLPDGRVLLWGWVRGFDDPRGWCGCMSIPRELSLGGLGELIQRPARELEKLRESEVARDDFDVAPGGPREVARGRTLELALNLRRDTAAEVVLTVLAPDDGTVGFAIRLRADGLHVGDTHVLRLQSRSDPLDLRVFVDRSVVEVFADGGRTCVTRVHHGNPGNDRVVLQAEDGTAACTGFRAWKLRGEGLFDNGPLRESLTKHPRTGADSGRIH